MSQNHDNRNIYFQRNFKAVQYKLPPSHHQVYLPRVQEPHEQTPALQLAVDQDAGNEGHHWNARQTTVMQSMVLEVWVPATTVTGCSPQLISLIQMNSKVKLKHRAVISNCQELLCFLSSVM